MSSKDIVLLSTADWDNPFWTNKQHVAVELNRQGHRVFYIDSLGLRRPTAQARDLRRIARRLAKAIRPPRKVRNGLWVWSPIVLPWHHQPLVGRFNRMLLSLGLSFWLRMLRLKRQWLWTYSPLTTRFLNLDRFDCCIYHCVDEIKAQPGMPVEVIAEAEEDLAQSADVIFTTSEQLTETRKVWNENTYYFPNVADFRHFNTALDEQTKVPADLLSIPEPRIGFVGAISGYKLDFRLIRHIAESRPDWSVVLIGEVGEGDPWTDASMLAGLPNLHLLGPRAYGDLPAYLKGFSVAMLPNQINPYTDAMFPMKFFEYLAAGCPVVSVDLKAIREFGEAVSVADTAEAFTAAIQEILKGNIVPLAQRLAVARAHTYEARTTKMLNLIENICAVVAGYGAKG